MKSYSITTIIFAGLSILLSCKEEEFPQATVTFYPTLAGLASEPSAGVGASTTITVQTSRVLPEASLINITIKGNGAGYGYSYATNPPQLEQGVVTLSIPGGENTGSFTFTPLNDGIFEPTGYDYTIAIDEYNNSIKSVGQEVFNLKVNDSTEPFAEFKFDVCSGTPGGFTESIVDGAMTTSTWGCTNFGYPGPGSFPSAAEANAYNKGDGTSNSYLVFPVINGADYSVLYLEMLVESYFTGAGSISFKYSSNYSGTGNPEAEGVLWTDLTAINDVLPAAGSRVWTKVGALVSDVPDSDFYFAIQYKGGTKGSASSWQIDNIQIKGN